MKQTKRADKDIYKYIMRFQSIDDDSDDEGQYFSECEEATQNTRRKARSRLSSTAVSFFLGSHQRFFRSPFIASNVNINMGKLVESCL